MPSRSVYFGRVREGFLLKFDLLSVHPSVFLWFLQISLHRVHLSGSYNTLLNISVDIHMNFAQNVSGRI